MATIDRKISIFDQDITAKNEPNTILTGSGDDRIIGGTNTDNINAGTGDNYIAGGSGNDTITTGAGDDEIWGGAGDDIVVYSRPAEDPVVNIVFNGGTGADLLRLGTVNTKATGDTYNGFLINNVSAYSNNDDATIITFDNGVQMRLTDVETYRFVNDAGTKLGVGFPFPSVKDYDYKNYTSESLEDALSGKPSANLTVTGDANDNVLAGRLGNDVINGNDGNDTIRAGDGNDTIDPGAGDDEVYGGIGDDIITAKTGTNLILGEDGNDTIYANGGLSGSPTNTINGGYGDDYIRVALGNHTVEAGYGNDVVDIFGFLQFGSTVADGSHDHDILRVRDSFLNQNTIQVTRDFDGTLKIVRPDATDLSGFSGSFTNFEQVEILALGGEQISLSTVDAFVEQHNTTGATYQVKLKPGTDSYTVTPDQYDDVSFLDYAIEADTNDSTITASEHNDYIKLFGGDDIAYGKDGNDRLVGGVGNDTLIGDSGDDVLYGDKAHEPGATLEELARPILYSFGVSDSYNDNLSGGEGNDRLFGGVGDDSLNGGSGNDVLFGQAGNDTLYATSGEDTINGGADEDTVIFSDTSTADISEYQNDAGVIHITTSNGKFEIENVENFKFSNAEFTYDNLTKTYGQYLVGTDGDDTLIGDIAGDIIVPKAGTDTVDGGAGNDTIKFDYDFGQVTGLTENTDGSLEVSTASSSTTLRNVENLAFTDATHTPEEALVRFAAVDPVEPREATIRNKTNLEKANFTRVENGSSEEFAPDDYAGGVEHLEDQYLSDSNGTDVVFGNVRNDFINLAGGDDAADGRAGHDVLDGGLGSNFLTGGEGNDIFFLDGRSGEVTWSTITDFTDGDDVNIWGWVEGTSQLLETVASDGAEGFAGVTFHYDLNNDSVIDTSITFTGLSESQVSAPTADIVEENGYLLFT